MEVGDSRWFLHLLREKVVQDSYQMVPVSKSPYSQEVLI